MSYWFRLRAHPDGLLPHPEFAVEGALAYPRVVPRGAPRSAWFEIDGGFVFATEHHPQGPGDEPWYEIVGSFLYPAGGHPDGPGFEARYQARATLD